ncbi:probable E3 ubiquitin-protein ligase DTX3 isoform X3 [Rhineura floridana]|uniref:probable E3 ubiquitin-protein ligase DTX3 isoform X3 n=1 Tax=Rhineura floridana TaxID=261503 RepID=UPI002AC7FDD0|nr:probable E3 ubiquitin-protein ligase DTX3 isoform X3 [Rhineura floridana]XP_061470654.1 probable E3 ubiquitin-protein ligase DTX3 isoform X3 [Rhineura floridana]XP_061470655.1 probable E3 ubiquitin-protein ligase DTX3 isoform X3 [Rhineura floridana]XP_061470656.1 probable E3 ubiquitin-protein ligase DTX3 isoform X3 [Rhineura floridana]
MGSPVSFVLSRMAACGGTTKNRLTVNKYVWDFLTKESPAKLVKLKEENKVSILIDGETSEIYVLQITMPAHGPSNALYLARKALKALLKETEKELKKAQRQSELMGCMALMEKNREHGAVELHRRGAALISRGQQTSGPRVVGGSGGVASCSRGGEEEQDSQCPICLGEIQNIKTLEKCKHSFCEDCITRALQVKKACPMCGRFYGQLVGNQPENGRMLVSKDSSLLLPSYEKYGTIIIQYIFPPGIQGVEHPNPGVRYPGTTRVAYLPDCPEGNKVLALFRKAFDQRLTFTIGTSMTTGRANVITWNDIHHKTSCTGGPQLESGIHDSPLLHLIFTTTLWGLATLILHTWLGCKRNCEPRASPMTDLAPCYYVTRNGVLFLPGPATVEGASSSLRVNCLTM